MTVTSRWTSICVLLVVVGITAIGRPIVSARSAPTALSPAAAAVVSPSPVTIVYAQAAPLPSGLAVDVAQAKGFLAAEEIGIASDLPTEAIADIVASVGNGALNLGATTVDAALAGLARGSESVIVASFSQFPAYALVAQPGIPDLAALKGKSLAASSRTAAEAPFLKLMLAKAALRYPDDYDIVVAGSLQERLAALEVGSVAAAIVPPPHDVRLIAGGKKRLLSPQETLDSYQHVVLLANRPWAREHPDTVVRFLRALHRSMYWLSEPSNKAEVARIIASNGSISPGDALGTYETYVAAAGTLCYDLRPSSDGLRQANRILAESGAGTLPDPERYVNLDYWEEATRNTVTDHDSTSVARR